MQPEVCEMAGMNNDVEQAERLGEFGETVLITPFPGTKVTRAPIQDCFRRYEIGIPGLNVFAIEFSVMECAEATQSGWPAAILSKVEGYLWWHGVGGTIDAGSGSNTCVSVATVA
jgi:hypothetical protein